MRFLWAVAQLALVAALSRSWVDGVVNGGQGSHHGGFPSLDETVDILKSLSTSNPNLVRRFVAGISVECRPMPLYLLSGMHLHSPQTVGEASLRHRARVLQRDLASDLILQDGVLIRSCANSTLFPQHRNLWQRILTEYSVPTLAATNENNTHGTSMDRKEEDGIDWSKSRGGVLLTALHHAREPASLTVPLNLFYWMTSSVVNWMLDSNPSREESLAVSVLRDRDVFFLPFVNPDGYAAIDRGGDPDLRKNRRRTCSKPSVTTLNELHAARHSHNVLLQLREKLHPPADPIQSPSLVDGVDLNRNYDSYFSSSNSGCNKEEYEGSFAFSEPETRAVRRVAVHVKPRVALNFHSYGDLWTHPYNCCPKKRFNAEDQALFDEIKASLNITHFNSAPHLEALGYKTSGEADDYLYDKLGILSMSPEVGPEEGGFYPNSNLIRLINTANLEITLRVISKAGGTLVGTWGQDGVVDLMNVCLMDLPPGRLYVSVLKDLPQNPGQYSRPFDHIRLGFDFRFIQHTAKTADAEDLFQRVELKEGLASRQHFQVPLSLPVGSLPNGAVLELCYRLSNHGIDGCQCGWFSNTLASEPVAFVMAPDVTEGHPCLATSDE
eukprot:Protomagalhaensia_sp_Gyna_25__571@NODE_126_length_5040_cov_41_993801_g99_i0_p1_GENE_NODE_126_length_5040_cov_41_993801_g99_i0NODE_126_length_5040_cov_41_993801_g99_i0_p1_ORF_typecomplete_len610_score107_88Peptidase_M14/PF00246_24/1_3e42AstE_AspA/PF04952_14/0_05_NODE_126_length_5040_cov_41_993801_g99_i06012430